MNIREDKKDQVMVLAIEGRLDSITSGTLEKKFLAVMDLNCRMHWKNKSKPLCWTMLIHSIVPPAAALPTRCRTG